MPDQPQTQPIQPVARQLAWGGYYAVREPVGYTVFRLLDINTSILHVQSFDNIFETPPSLEQITLLRPQIAHMPLTPVNLMSWEGSSDITLIGSRPLTPDDLEGYKEYLAAMGATPEAIAEVVAQLVASSLRPPMNARLTAAANGDVVIEPA